MSLKDFINGYMECALWSSHDGDHETLDSFSFEDISEDCLKQMKSDCEEFYSKNLPLWEGLFYSDERAGHDFWLSRNGHGSGFLDRKEIEPVRDILDKRAEKYSMISLYVGDDQKIWSE